MTEPNDAATFLQLVILTPEQILFEGPVDWAEIPLVDGWIGIGPGHAPLIAALGQGEVRFTQGAERRELAIAGGILHIDQMVCAVLTGSIAREDAEPSVDALAERLEEALEDVLGQDLGTLQEI